MNVSENTKNCIRKFQLIGLGRKVRGRRFAAPH
jgi:hypothetical protein